MSAPHEAPNLDRLYSINLDGSRNMLHPADVKGRFVTRRRIVFAVLMIIYLALPVVHVGGHPAMHLDIAARRFYLFGAVYNAQDVWLMVFIGTGGAFTLLFLTAWLGRVWCGWSCPQTVFLEGVYRPIERLIEGSRIEQIRLAEAPWGPKKIAKKVTKHIVFIIVSLMVGHITLSLFVSTRSMLDMMRHSPSEHWEAFLWTMGIAGVFYFNFAWFREQFCVVLCPYGRLQSALIDRDSLIVGYDRHRGEPRGKITKAGRVEGAGDCVDCNRCVVVCPTGIDIRNGLQMECIACTQCIDACDEIMDKVSRPRGLIRYDSQKGLEREPKRRLQPRLFLYGFLVLGSLAGAIIGTTQRQPLEANLIRDRGAPWVLEPANIRNQFELHLVNKHPGAATFHVEVQTPTRSSVVLPRAELHLESMESARVPIFVSVANGDYTGPFEITVKITEPDDRTVQRVAKARFLGPLKLQ